MARNEYILDLRDAGRFRVNSFAEAKRVARKRTGVSRIVGTTVPMLIRTLINYNRPGASSLVAGSNSWFVKTETEFKHALRSWEYTVHLYTSPSLNAEFIGEVRLAPSRKPNPKYKGKR